MNRAIVIKTIGDPAITGAIVDGMTKTVIPLNERELTEMKAQYKRLQAVNGVRQYGDSVRWEIVRKALEVKYSTPKHGRLYNVILMVWGTFWAFIYDWFDYFSAWNREP